MPPPRVPTNESSPLPFGIIPHLFFLGILLDVTSRDTRPCHPSFLVSPSFSIERTLFSLSLYLISSSNLYQNFHGDRSNEMVRWLAQKQKRAKKDFYRRPGQASEETAILRQPPFQPLISLYLGLKDIGKIYWNPPTRLRIDVRRDPIDRMCTRFLHFPLVALPYPPFAAVRGSISRGRFRGRSKFRRERERERRFRRFLERLESRRVISLFGSGRIFDRI